MLIRTSALGGLAEEIKGIEGPIAAHWQLVHTVFLGWVNRPEFSEHLRAYLRDLPPHRAREVTGRSRETTTHFAWCLLGEPDAEFSFWLHEYKPQRDWRPGYADSVHNHRYHFCTTMLHGSYLQERYDAELDPTSGMITSVTPRARRICDTGSSGVLLASDFHRILSAADDTMTFLVKSRSVTGWSLSYDPEYGTGHRHVPVETRLGEMLARI